MRARFNLKLDGNIASLIFKRLSRLDLCLSKAVCRDWRRLISQKHREKLEFKTDFCKTLVKYDRLEYVSAVERWTLFSNKSISLHSDDRFLEAVWKTGAIYSYLFYNRITRKEVLVYNGIWSICKNFPHLWEIFVFFILVWCILSGLIFLLELELRCLGLH
jgi:hypothetical protein